MDPGGLHGKVGRRPDPPRNIRGTDNAEVPRKTAAQEATEVRAILVGSLSRPSTCGDMDYRPRQHMTPNEVSRAGQELPVASRSAWRIDRQSPDALAELPRTTDAPGHLDSLVSEVVLATLWAAAVHIANGIAPGSGVAVKALRIAQQLTGAAASFLAGNGFELGVPVAQAGPLELDATVRLGKDGPERVP